MESVFQLRGEPCVQRRRCRTIYETALPSSTVIGRMSPLRSRDFLESYRPRWERAGALAEWYLSACDRSRECVRPRPAQQGAMHELAIRRRLGVRRAVVIGATGLGKTHLAAFDFKQSGMQMSSSSCIAKIFYTRPGRSFARCWMIRSSASFFRQDEASGAGRLPACRNERVCDDPDAFPPGITRRFNATTSIMSSSTSFIIVKLPATRRFSTISIRVFSWV